MAQRVNKPAFSPPNTYPNLYTTPPNPNRPNHFDSTGRLSYPTFLSLPQTLQLHLTWACKGLLDALRWNTVVTTVLSDPEVRTHFVKSLLLNSVSLISIYTFDLLLRPLVKDQQRWLHRNVGWFYKVLWLFPVVGASLYLNGSWCTVVAKRTHILQHGNRNVMPAASYAGMLTAIATSAYRFIMVFTSVIISIALGYVPILGPFIEFVFFCWINSFYCFEFVWITKGLSLSQRIRSLEEHWAYYLAFGFPSAALCMWGSSLANAALFALILPSYIIMAMHAHPVPMQPYNPLAPQDGSVLYPSPFIPIRMPILAPVVWLNDRVVSVFSVGGVKDRSAKQPGLRGTEGRKRGMSESTAVSVEEGTIDQEMELNALLSFPAKKGHEQSSGRGIRVGSRKFD